MPLIRFAAAVLVALAALSSIVFAARLATPSGDGPPAALAGGGATTHTVEVRDNKFCSTGEQECSGTGVPHDLFIDKPGDSVVWEWIDTLNIHNVTECTEGWSACGPDVHESNPIGASPTQTEGDHGPIQFGETGIFYYRCTIHPSQMTGRVFVGVTPAPTPSPGPETPTPTPTPDDGDLWGDIDCDGTVAIGDALKTARHLLGLSVAQEEGCPLLGTQVEVDGLPRLWGDVDCDGEIGIGDALKTARHLLGLSITQEEGCPGIGETVEVE